MMTRIGDELNKFVDDTSKKIFGQSRTEARKEEMCVICTSKKMSDECFRDRTSIAERNISQMCQVCQDDIFGRSEVPDVY